MTNYINLKTSKFDEGDVQLSKLLKIVEKIIPIYKQQDKLQIVTEKTEKI